MKNLGFLGKLLYALPLAMFGFFHFMNANSMAGMVPDFLPAPVIWVYLTGASLLAAVISIIIGKKTKLATLLLGIMLLSFALLIHMQGFFNQDPVSSGMFLKDLALAGAAFFISSHSKN